VVKGTSKKACDVDSLARLHEAFATALATNDGTFAERETRALEVSNELVRRWLQDELQRMATTFTERVAVNGATYRLHATGTKRYHTLVGAIDVERASYRAVGCHNGSTVIPLDLAAGIVENATPALAFSVTRAFAERPLRHYEDEMQAAHRDVPSRSTLERIGKRVGRRIREALPIIEPMARTIERSARTLARYRSGSIARRSRKQSASTARFGTERMFAVRLRRSRSTIEWRTWRRWRSTTSAAKR
jgi:hypothetical protein